MIDLHCHALPGLDDGPPDIDASLALCRAAADAGTRTIVATPHVSWNHPHVTAAAVAEAVARLNEALRAAGTGVDVRPGAEVALTRAVDLPDHELAALRLGGGPFLLVECPYTPAADAVLERILHALAERGHRIVLAHPERCPAFQHDLARLRELVDAGMLTAVTAGAFAGRFGRVVERVARGLLADGLVHAIASDAHNAYGRRPPTIAPELEQAGLGERADYHARAVPAAILAGTELPPPPPPPRRGLGVLRRA